jgi:hypothetical protein
LEALGIVIEGSIAAGDYEKFLDALLEGGSTVDQVLLASPAETPAGHAD